MAAVGAYALKHRLELLFEYDYEDEQCEGQYGHRKTERERFRAIFHNHRMLAGSVYVECDNSVQGFRGLNALSVYRHVPAFVIGYRGHYELRILFGSDRTREIGVGPALADRHLCFGEARYYRLKHIHIDVIEGIGALLYIKHIVFERHRYLYGIAR